MINWKAFFLYVLVGPIVFVGAIASIYNTSIATEVAPWLLLLAEMCGGFCYIAKYSTK